MDGPLTGYTCPKCGFDTDITNCDECDAVVKWDDDDREVAHCTGCGAYVERITCRECGFKFNLHPLAY